MVLGISTLLCCRLGIDKIHHHQREPSCTSTPPLSSFSSLQDRAVLNPSRAQSRAGAAQERDAEPEEMWWGMSAHPDTSVLAAGQSSTPGLLSRLGSVWGHRVMREAISYQPCSKTGLFWRRQAAQRLPCGSLLQTGYLSPAAPACQCPLWLSAAAVPKHQ